MQLINYKFEGFLFKQKDEVFLGLLIIVRIFIRIFIRISFFFFIRIIINSKDFFLNIQKEIDEIFLGLLIIVRIFIRIRLIAVILPNRQSIQLINYKFKG